MTRIVLLSLVGLTVWAISFATVYALHGTGCAYGWPARPTLGPLSLHRLAMLAVWGAGLLIGLWTVLSPRFAAPLPRMGAWIGLVATGFTLAPIVLLGEC